MMKIKKDRRAGGLLRQQEIHLSYTHRELRLSWQKNQLNQAAKLLTKLCMTLAIQM